MFNSSVLDVAIGLVFVFLLLSLICSAANELIELVLKKRAQDLERGIRELIGDSANTDAFVSGIYNHGLVNSLFRGKYDSKKKKLLPSYIPARNFALALIAVKKDLDSKAVALPENLGSAFEAFEREAGTDAAKLQRSIEDWYNSSMDRVSGWYKRRTQIIIFALGILAAVLANADCIQIAKRLSTDSNLRQAAVQLAEAQAKTEQKNADVPQAVQSIKTNLATLDGIGLPVGWKEGDDKSLAGLLKACSDHWFGWLLTALAVSLGAPFWFDVLNKFIVVRSTVKPQEKSKEGGAKKSSTT